MIWANGYHFGGKRCRGRASPEMLDAFDSRYLKDDVGDFLHPNGGFHLGEAPLIKRPVFQRRPVPDLVRRHGAEEFVDELYLRKRDQRILDCKEHLRQNVSRVNFGSDLNGSFDANGLRFENAYFIKV